MLVVTSTNAERMKRDGDRSSRRMPSLVPQMARSWLTSPSISYAPKHILYKLEKELRKECREYRELRSVTCRTFMSRKRAEMSHQWDRKVLGRDKSVHHHSDYGGGAPGLLDP